MVDPMVLVIDRLPVRPETKTHLLWGCRYAICVWATAVYYGLMYSDHKNWGFEAFYAAVFWPLFWFVESIRFVVGAI